MTDSPPMFEHFIADGETPTKFDLMTLVQGLGGGAVFTGILAFLAQRGNSKDTTRDKADDRANVIEGKRMEIEASERERLLKIFQDDKQRAIDAESSIRTEMLQMRRTFGHEIRNIQQHMSLLSEFYHQLYAVARDLSTSNRMMRARLKRYMLAAKESFDEDEFPVIDLAPFDPKVLPKFSVYSDAEDAKTIGKVELMIPKPLDMEALKKQFPDLEP